MKKSNLIHKEIVNFDSKVKSALRQNIGVQFANAAEKRSRTLKVQRIRYKSDGLAIEGFILHPRKRGIYPCILYARGGNRDFGEITSRTLWTLLSRIASWGYVVVASQYRGSTNSEGNDEFGGRDVNDILNLIPILREIPSADYKRMGIFGWSRGALMTLLAMKKIRHVKAVILGGAAVDLVAQSKYRPEMYTVFEKRIPHTSKAGLIRELRRRSAIYWSEQLSKKIPILLMHGSADWRVQPDDAIRFSQKLFENNIPHRFILFEGADHGIHEFQDEVMQEAQRWFERFVKGGEALPNLIPHGQ